MKPSQRRTAGTYPYYKIAIWSPIIMSFSDLNRIGTFASEEEARTAARRFGPGRYRVSEVYADGRRIRCDRLPFEVSVEEWQAVHVK